MFQRTKHSGAEKSWNGEKTKMEFEIVKLSKILATTDYRTLSKVEKAAKLVTDNHCGMGLLVQPPKLLFFVPSKPCCKAEMLGKLGNLHCLIQKKKRTLIQSSKKNEER